MRIYETMIIFDTEVEETDIKAFIQRIKDLLEAQGGKLTDTDIWGRRQLAYEIKHKRDGYYVVLTADAEPDAVAEVGRVLTLSDSVLRYKTMRLPDKVAQPAEASK